MVNSIDNVPKRQPLISLISIEMTDSDRLTVEFDILKVSTFSRFYSVLRPRIDTLDFIYFAFAIISTKDWELIHALLDLKEREISIVEFFITFENYRHSRNLKRVERLKLASIHYGSPASFDFIGIGKVLEVVRDIIKDLVWRGKYEKKLANVELKIKASEIERAKLERKKQNVEIQKAQADVEKVILELAEKKITLLEKVMDLELGDEYKHRLAAILLPELWGVARIPPFKKALSSSKTTESSRPA